ncbi:MAG: UvrD-helicase domain-containing protein [Anaerolineae bacterium]|nr:UvrD-helicase domain-containing protein [Anaerolineae bacterium]
MASGLLEGLNPQQREAVTAGLGPVIIYAGPGSGKTRVLTYRLAYLVKEMGVYPGAVMAVTFTNKAATEMRTRAETLLGSRLKGIQIGTFHAICARILRREAENTPYRTDYLIYDTDDQLSVVTQAMVELNIDTKRYNPRRVLGAISNAKNELITPSQFKAPDYFHEIVARVYPAYQEILVANNAVDFDDLLMETVLLLRDNPEVAEKYGRFYEHILVDEFQDTNMAQYKLVQLFGRPQDNIFVVGDEDQGIYAFRGADYRNVRQFRQDYPDAKMIILAQNYRSTQIVLDAARAVIDKNPHRQPKDLFTDRKGGAKIYLYEAYNEEEEGDYVAEQVEFVKQRDNLNYKDFVVMYRTKAQSRALEDKFMKRKVPYKLIGDVGFYKRREVRDLLAYLRVIHNPDDSVSFNRIVNVPKRGIGKKSLVDFQAWVGQKHMTYSEALTALVDGETVPITSRSLKSLVEFAQQVHDWQELAATGDLVALFDDIIVSTSYHMHLRDTSDSNDEFTEREENIQEFRGQLEKTSSEELSLSEFLTEIALVADVDTLDAEADAVTLLTLHSAKGLEFPVVFMTGLEDGLLPHLRSMDDPEGMAEERRLMYVGLTRAKDQVYLTYAFRRFLYGSSETNLPSRFLADIPADLTDGIYSSGNANLRDSISYQRETTWDQTGSNAARSKIIPFPSSAAAPKARPEPKLQYRSGMRVRHAKFGEGVVIESQRSGDDEEVTVAFAAHGIKRLAASFARLTVVE